MALARDREQTSHSLPAGISDFGGDVPNFPVTVPISQDGEEGYQLAQQRLIHYHTMDCEVDRESVHPPPNRTVYDGESPPQYRARLFTHPTGGSTTMDSKHTAVAEKSTSTVKMPTQVITGSGRSPVARCFNRGLSNNNNTNNVNLNSSCLGGGLTQHPLHQYHSPHSYPQTGAAHNGHPRAPNNYHHQHHQMESPTGVSSSGHSRGSSTNSAYSSHGSPPNYDDIIATKFTRHSKGPDV